MNFDERLGQMRSQTRAQPGASHGVPLVADAAGIEQEREGRIGCGYQRRRLRCDEAALEVGREEAAIREETILGRTFARRLRPLEGRQRFERSIADIGIGADIKITRAAIFERGKGGVLAEDVGRGSVGECIAEAEPLRDLADDPPVRLRLAGRRQETALARDAALGIRDGAAFLAPCCGGQEDVRAAGDCVVGQHVFRHDEQFELVQCRAYDAGIRQRDRRVGRHHPQRLDLAAGDGLEHLNRFEALAFGHARRFPEAPHAVDLKRREAHVSGKLVGEPADLAPAHRIRLAGERERTHAGSADAAGGEVAIDDGVDLVGALRRLIHALRESGDDIFRRCEHLEESQDVGCRQTGRLRNARNVRRDHTALRERVLESLGMRGDILEIQIVACRRDNPATPQTTPSPCRALPAGTGRLLPRSPCGADRSRRSSRPAHRGSSPCARTAPDGTTRRWSRSERIQSHLIEIGIHAGTVSAPKARL